MSAVPSPAPLRKAVKLARLGIDLSARTGLFFPWADTLPYAAEGHAECVGGGDHAAPATDCTCGFYAAYDADGLMTLLQPSHGALAGAALLSVELGGVEIAGPQAVRAEQQRVLGAQIMPLCPLCDAAQPSSAPPGLYAWTTGGSATHRWVVPLCESHAQLSRDIRRLSLGDVAGMLGTEVTWASTELAWSFLDWRDTQLAAGEARGPLASDRTLGQLRMGQVGFTTTDALRVHDGELHVDLASPALQREQGGAYVPILRRVDLRHQLVLTAANAEAIETALLQPRRLNRAVRMAPLQHVTGLRHSTRLSQIVGR
jgi:hypothetical protein